MWTFRKPLLAAICLLGSLASAAPATPYPSHASNGTWTVLPSLPHAWQEHSSVALADDIYIMGGVLPATSQANGSFSVPTIAEVARYSVSRKTWTPITSMPAALNHPNAISHRGKVYVLGGLAPAASDPLDWVPSRSAFAYDPATNEWEGLPPVPTAHARGSAAMASYGDHIILAGGMVELKLRPNFTQASVNIVSVFNTRTRTWHSLPSLPEARDHTGYAVVGSKFFVLGGRDQGQQNVRDTVFIMDLNRQERGWTQGARMPTARGGCTAGKVGEVIYVFGGEGDPTPGNNGVFPEVEAYDTRTDSWRRLPNMPTPRHGTVAASLGDKIYVPGGGIAISAAPVDTFDVFKPGKW